MVRTVFMGSDLFSLPVAEALGGDDSAGYGIDLVGIVTQPDRPAGRGRATGHGPIKKFAEERSLPVLQPVRLREPDAMAQFAALRPDLVVVASFGQILPRRVLELPRHGCLNLHPSLLPKYRGPSPIAGPILAGDRCTGTTVMVMSPRMDAGDIVAQQSVSIEPDETSGELEARLSVLSAGLLLQVLPDWIAGRSKPVAQNERNATYTARISKSDGDIDWSLPAVELARRVRAFNPWPVAYTFSPKGNLRVLRARAERGDGVPGQVIDISAGGLRVGTGRDLLAITEMQLAGGRPLAAEAMLRGHPSLLQARFGTQAAW